MCAIVTFLNDEPQGFNLQLKPFIRESHVIQKNHHVFDTLFGFNNNLGVPTGLICGRSHSGCARVDFVGRKT